MKEKRGKKSPDVACEPAINDSNTIYPCEIESEYFTGVIYAIKEGHIIVNSKKNGMLCLMMENVRLLAKELLEICEVYT